MCVWASLFSFGPFCLKNKLVRDKVGI